MQNRDLAFDYIDRAEKRIAALVALLKEEAWADVVREAQELVELALKSLLRFSSIDVPRVHDVSKILLEQKELLPAAVHEHVEELARISKTLRRDRELAFYGSEDLIPSEFYTLEDAQEAFAMATKTTTVVRSVVVRE